MPQKLSGGCGSGCDAMSYEGECHPVTNGTCLHQDERLTSRIYGYLAKREALQPWMPSSPLPVVNTPQPMSAPSKFNVPTASYPLVPMRNIMTRFQSLGDNCEFGFVQRYAEAEPLGLLRFAGFSIPVEHRLQYIIKALTDGFDGLGVDPQSIACELHGEIPRREFMIRETRWNLLYHTGRYDGEIEQEKLRLQQGPALQFRRRMLLEDLKAAQQIFVWKSNLATPETEVRHLVSCLRGYGPNLLLWIRKADADHPVGLVEYAGDQLLKGYVARFAPYEAAGDIDFDSWHAVCQNAVAAANFLQTYGEWSSPNQK